MASNARKQQLVVEASTSANVDKKMGLFSTIVGLILSKEVCYNSDNIGCFDNSKPFDNALHKVPDSPSTIGVSKCLSLCMLG